MFISNINHVYVSHVGFVCGLGDVIAQTLVEKKQLRAYNMQRTATMTAIGFLFTVSISARCMSSDNFDVVF